MTGLDTFIQLHVSKCLSEAILHNNVVQKTAFRTIIAALEYNSKLPEKSQKTAYGVISAEIRKLHDAITLLEDVHELDRASAYREEMEVMQTLLPEPLTVEEIKSILKTVIDEQGGFEVLQGKKNSIGLIMKYLVPQIEGRFVSSHLPPMIREALGIQQ